MGRAIFLPAIVLIIIGIVCLVPSGDTWQINNCYCWNEMNDTLKEKIPTLPLSRPLPKYHYTGVKLLSADYFTTCECSDVTRIQAKFNISSSDVFDAVVNNTDVTLTNMTDAINLVFTSKDSEGILVSFDQQLESAETSPVTIWNIEITTRGFDANAESLVNNFFKAHTAIGDGTYVLETVGKIEPLSMEFSFVECSGDPIPASSNGIRTWNNLRLPGVRVDYSCNRKYFISEPTLAFSECSHLNLTWTPPTVNITCKRGCQDEPETGPFFSIRNWNPTLREDGHEAIFTCMDGYRSTLGPNGSSICDGALATWSNIDTKFACEQILCSKDIPQVPSFAISNWDETVFIGTEIIYKCIEEYAPTVRGIIKVHCDTNGDWTRYPLLFKCINIDLAIKLGYFADSSYEYNYYLDALDRKPEDTGIISYFPIVTLPCFIAMAVIVILCMCCTRINSWLYELCTGKTKNISYVATI